MSPDLKIQLYIYCLGKQISICSPRSLNNLYQSSLTIEDFARARSARSKVKII